MSTDQRKGRKAGIRGFEKDQKESPIAILEPFCYTSSNRARIFSSDCFPSVMASSKFLCGLFVLLLVVSHHLDASDACKPSRKKYRLPQKQTTTQAPSVKEPCEDVFPDSKEREQCRKRYMCGLLKISHARHLTGEENLLKRALEENPSLIPRDVATTRPWQFGLPEKICDFRFDGCKQRLYPLRKRMSVM